MKTSALRTFVVVVTSLLAACGNVREPVAPSSKDAPPLIGVDPQITANAVITRSVTWSVQEGASGGSVTSGGVFTAGATPGTYHLLVASSSDPTVSTTVTVNVTTPPPAGSAYALPADRATTWRPGVTYNGGIPNRTTTCATLSPLGGTQSDSAQIQAAIDACPAGQVVLLRPGTFRITNLIEIHKSNITLRGSGAGSTILLKPSATGESVLALGTRWYSWTDRRNLTADAAKGANQITLASTTGLVVGEVVHVNETYDPALTYFNPAQQNGDYQGWGEGRLGPQAASRPIGQAVEITAINGNVITISSVLHTAFRVSKTAHIARISNGATVQQPVAWSGIENLTFEGGDGGDGGGNVNFFAAKYCWAKNIESRKQRAGGAFVLDGCFRCELRDSYLHQATDPNPGGAGYGYVVDTYSADNLAENNIIWSFNKVMAMRSSGGGNVFGYNYVEDMYGQGYPTIVEVGMNAAHMAGSHMELFEGNQGANADSEAYWGNSINIVWLRNHLTTLRRNLPGNLASLSDAANRRGIGLGIKSWWYSFVGNVIGYPSGYLQSPVVGSPYPSTFAPQPQGTVFRYEWTGGAFGNDASPAYTPMWQIGYDGTNWPTTQDATTAQRTLRDGNFDYFTNAVHWHGIGGTGVTQTTAPAASTLPDSLYLTGKPAFFGSNPWPWVDGSSATSPIRGTLPARTRFDAGTPNVVP